MMKKEEPMELIVARCERDGAYLAEQADAASGAQVFLPVENQTRRVRVGEQVLAAVFDDEAGRTVATMNVYPYLRAYSPYRVNDEVEGRIYETSENFGIFVAVDDIYSALIPKQEVHGRFEIGEKRKLRVTKITEDGRLNLSARKKAYQQINPDADLIRDYLRYHPEVPFDDTATPAQIDEVFGISKAAFKRALGHLLKEKEVKKEDGKIRPLED